MAKRLRRSEDWWTNHPDVLRCTAHYKSNGQQCQMQAAPGTNVCNQHGALAPAVQARAAVRIQMSVDDAVKRLHAMLEDANVDARDKIKILHDLLDRGGLGATSKHLIGVVTDDPVERLFTSILSDPNAIYDPATLEPKAITVDAAQAALDAVEVEPDPSDFFGRREAVSQPEDVVDAEVVDGDDELVVTDAPPPHIRKALARLL